jgi:hypothetical protein
MQNPMQLSRKTYPPQLKHFALTLAVTYAVYLLICLLTLAISVLVYGNSIGAFWQGLVDSAIVWMFPLMGAGTYAFALKKQELSISPIPDPRLVAGWMVDFLQEDGLEIIARHDENTELASPYSFHRMFRYWLGAELLTVRYTSDKVIVTGHYRHIEKVDTKFRFNKPVFHFEKQAANLTSRAR